MRIVVVIVVVVVVVVVVIVVPKLLLLSFITIFPPAYDFHVQGFQPLPYIPTRAAGVAEGSEGAPTKS